MNDLARYERIRGSILPGDLFLFDGSDDSDLVELIEHVLPNGIETLTRSNWSHVALALNEDCLIESTILNGVSGPQINVTFSRLADYDGCSVYWLPLSGVARQSLNITAALDWARSRVGIDKYSVLTISHYILRPLLGWAIPALRRSIPGQEVCSEYIAMAYERAGINSLLKKPVEPHTCSPGAIAKWPVWSSAPVQVVGGLASSAAK